MINEQDNPVAWALLVQDLDEAREHLAALIDQMHKDVRIDEEDYAVQLGHVFAHLNRDWNARNLAGEIPVDEYGRFSRFPEDLEPVG